MSAKWNSESLRILIIDDDPEWRDMISELASYLGHRPQTLGERSTDLANQVEAVLQEAETNGDPIALVTIDWAFEVGKGQTESQLGQQILRRLKLQYPHIACILISGTTDAAYRLLKLRDRYNLDAYIPKVNLNEDTLADAIKTGLERVQAMEQTEKDTPVEDPQLARLEKLHRNLTTYFSENDLQNLCFWLGVDYENLGSNTKEGKARELIQYIQRQNRLSTLLEKCQEMRPLVSW